jgi:hypothetical protein
MKKLLFFFLVCVIIIPCARSLEIKDRIFEVGINAAGGFANDAISAKDIFQETFVLDIDEISKNFRIFFGADISPLYFNYNNKNNWGFGLSTGVTAEGSISLSEKILSFSEAVEDKSEINGAVFAEIGIPAFFHFKKFRIKIKPALYYPVVYTKSEISYTFFTNYDGTEFNIGYVLDIYTAFPMEDSAYSNLTARPGIDFSAEAEYPLSEVLGLKDKLFLLDFDVGLALYNIPLIPSVMDDYMKLEGRIGSDAPIVFDKDMDLSSVFSVDSDLDTEYGKKKQNVLRPFKMLAWADWRPLGVKFFTVTPVFGFTINPLYNKPFSLETGVKASFDIGNIFLAAFGIGYYDRLWKNSVDLALNFRAFELDLGFDLRAANFTKSWTGGGLGANLGFKFGW